MGVRQDSKATDENVACGKPDGNDMRDHRRFGFGVAHGKGTNLWFAFRIDRRDRVAQQLIGGSVLQGDPVEGPPADKAHQRLDQRIGS
jgi:hypothetical protein